MCSYWTSDMIVMAMKSIGSDMFLIIVCGLAGSSRMRRGMRGDWTRCWWQRCELCIHGVFTRREGEEQRGKKGREKGLNRHYKNVVFSLSLGQLIFHVEKTVPYNDLGLLIWVICLFFQWSVIDWCYYERGFFLSVSLCLHFICWIFAGIFNPSICKQVLQYCRCVVDVSTSCTPINIIYTSRTFLWPQCTYLLFFFNYYPHKICVIIHNV